SDKFCHRFRLFPRISLDDLHDRAAYDCAIGEFPNRGKLLGSRYTESDSDRQIGKFANPVDEATSVVRQLLLSARHASSGYSINETGRRFRNAAQALICTGGSRQKN